MTSKVGISNLALSRLGASTITSLTDGTTEANLCNTFFDELIDRVIMQGRWTSTIKRTSLAKTTNTPAFEFANEFQLPVDPKCLQVLAIDEDTHGTTPYTIEGDKLLTDNSSIKIKYIARITDSEDWDPMLTHAFELLLTSYLALPISGDKAMAQALREEYEQVVQLNLSIDAQQGNGNYPVSDDLTVVR